MKKQLLLLILIINLFFSQDINQFIAPEYSKNKSFFYQISSTSSLKSPKGKIYHAPSHVNQNIELTFLYYDVKDKIYSWKVTDYEHKHENCNKCNKQSFRNNITILVKIDSLGRYKTINNLFQVKQSLLNNITEQEKVSKKEEKESLSRIKKTPESIISNMEEDIIIFFRYYGLESENSINTVFTRRNNFPFGLKKQPFKVSLAINTYEDSLKMNVNSEFDKNKAEDEDYNIIRFNQNVEKLKLKYNLTAQEEYVFSKENFRLLSAKITAKEISNFHDDGIYDYQYTITQKE